MPNLFTPSFFINNRKNLLAKLPDSTVVILSANGLIQKSSDSTFKFKQDASFWYLTGLDHEDLILVLSKKHEFIVTSDRDKIKQIFDGSINNESLKAISGIKTIYASNVGWQNIKQVLDEHKTVAGLPALPSYIKRAGFYTNPARRRLLSRLKRIKKFQMHNLASELVSLRQIKQPTEIKAINQAISITGQALNQINANLKSYTNEKQIESDLINMMTQAGMDEQAFDPIIAGGKHATTLHYMNNNGAVSSSDLIVIDSGASFNHYCADVTRTYALSKPTNRQKDIYTAALDVQNYALSELGSGIVLNKYEDKVKKYMGAKLKQLGLISDTSSPSIRQYFPHRTSHFLGLDTHDVGFYDQPLKPGVVITCEPGIYIPEEGIGVRIEDDILITKNGNQILSKNIIKPSY